MKLRATIISAAIGLGLLCATPFRSYAPVGCTNTVQNTFDSGPGSLRAALANASNGDTITFCPDVIGAITLTNGPLFVSNSVTILGPGPANLAINGNRGVQFGPVFYVNSNQVVTIAGLAITNSTVGGTFGGGIYNDHSTLTVSNCLISGNFAADGGGIYNDGRDFGSAMLTIVASTLSSNTANEAGGGIYNDGFGSGRATLKVIASTLSNNSSADGGGIYSRGSLTNITVSVLNSTLSSNSASFAGGGIALFGPGVVINPDDDLQATVVTIANGTLNGNSGGSGDSIYNSGSSVIIGSTVLNVRPSGTNIFNTASGFVGSVGYNLSSDNGSGFLTGFGDQTNTPALLGPLQDNGGPTFTHAPFCGSPAIDKGRNSSFPPLLTDQRGALRPVDIAGITNAPFGDGTDIGAVEVPIWLFNVQNTNDSGAGSLRQAILDANASGGIDFIEFAPSAYGTITLTSGELSITDCLFLNGPGATNVAVDGNATSRIFHIAPGNTVTIASLTITNGSAASTFGGGILNDHSVLSISNCIIISNSAAQGGGIDNDGSSGGSATMSLVNSTVSDNSSVASGGGIRNYGSSGSATLMVANTTLSGNSASAGGGGGIYNSGSSGGQAATTIHNSTLSGNSGPNGSGIVNLLAALTIGSTILNASSSPIITNISGSVSSLGFNLSSDDGNGFLTSTGDQTNTIPLLGPLQLNGGQTLTHALLCGSPAIDHGTNFLGLATDQRGIGFPRKVGAATDTGAFEGSTSCNQPPVALCTNITVSADSNCLASASIDNGSYDPDVGDSITNSVQTPVGPYSLGTNLVTLTVTDNHGASSSCTGMVLVVDATRPTIGCPSNIVATNDSGQCTAVVSFDATATDNCGMGSISSEPASGSTFSKGTNTVTVTAVDSADNTNTCTFTITVLDKEAPLVMCRPAPNPSGKVSEPGKNGTNANPSGYYQVLAKDNCDANPAIYIKDTKSPFVAGPFKDGDIVRLKHAGGAPSSVPGSAPIVAVISLKGNGLSVAQDADGNRTPDASGCAMAVR